MKVIAAKGLRVPMQDKPRSYIGDAEAIDVPDSAYYRRRIAEGDLLEPKAGTSKTTTKGSK